MPESDAIYRSAVQLRKALAGRTINESRVWQRWDGSPCDDTRT